MTAWICVFVCLYDCVNLVFYCGLKYVADRKPKCICVYGTLVERVEINARTYHLPYMNNGELYLGYLPVGKEFS